MSEICAICNLEFEDEILLNRHIRVHKLTIEKYYQTNFPRKDLFTGEFIEFKNKYHYLSNFFNSKENIKQWIKTKTDDEIRAYLKESLSQRKQLKGLKYALTQTELRSLISPSIVTFSKYVNYNSLCEEIGLINKFNYEIPKITQKPASIIVDTREQQAFEFDVPTKREKLDYGDYCLEDIHLRNSCYLERKNCSDFISTFTSGFDRFKRELDRAKANNDYLVVLCEESLDTMLNFKNQLDIPVNFKITPDYLFHNIRELNQTYDNIQFLFSKGRKEAIRLAKVILFSDIYNKYDLEWLYDIKAL